MRDFELEPGPELAQDYLRFVEYQDTTSLISGSKSNFHNDSAKFNPKVAETADFARFIALSPN